MIDTPGLCHRVNQLGTKKNIDSFPGGRSAGVTPGRLLVNISDYNERQLKPMSSASLNLMTGGKNIKREA